MTSPILEFLTAMARFGGGSPAQGFKYRNVHDYFLQRGASMQKPAPATKEQLAFVKLVVRSRQLKQCFYNSQSAVLADRMERLTYCEGFWWSPRLPIAIHHGWLMLDVGRKNPVLVDPTLLREPASQRRWSNFVVGAVPEGWEYFGCAFPVTSVRARWASGEAGSLIDWFPNWPFLRPNAALSD